MDLDVTLFFMLGLLLVLVILLDRLVFAPLLHVIESRHQQTLGARAEVRQMVRLTEADNAAYSRGISEARRQAFAELEQLRQRGRARVREYLEAAAKTASRQLQSARDDAAADERAALALLQPGNAPLAQQLAAQFLGRPVAERPQSLGQV